MAETHKRYSPIDALGIFGEDVTLAATATVQSGSPAADTIIDLIGGAHDIEATVDITAVEIASNNELYSFLFQGSSSSSFASDIVNLAIMQFGATEVVLGGGNDTVVGRYKTIVSNYYAGFNYRYVRLRVIIAGTIATGITFSAWLGRARAI